MLALWRVPSLSCFLICNEYSVLAEPEDTLLREWNGNGKRSMMVLLFLMGGLISRAVQRAHA